MDCAHYNTEREQSEPRFFRNLSPFNKKEGGHREKICAERIEFQLAQKMNSGKFGTMPEKRKGKRKEILETNKLPLVEEGFQGNFDFFAISRPNYS